MMDSKNINLVSININGLNNPIKRKRTLAYIKKLKVDIAFLQETHLIDLEHQKLKREWVGQVVYSSFNSKARGVAILINKKLPFKIQSVITDVAGRYVVIHCLIYSEAWTLLNLYVSNPDDEQFIQDVFLHLSNANENILIGGDFNCCLDSILDRTSRSSVRPKIVKKVLNLMKDLNLIDIWRRLNPKEKDYSFYSFRYDSYSRIDLFLLSSQVQDRITQVSYKARVISDHSPLLMSCIIPEREKTVYSWRFDSSLLKRKDFCEYMRREIQEFLQINVNSINDKFIIWEALKAYVRGLVISYSAKIKKDYLRESEKLEKEIELMEKELQRDRSLQKRNRLIGKKLHYNLLQTYRMEKLIEKTKQRYYELGERAHKVLAWQLKKEQVSKTINAIKKKNTGEITYKPQEINETFRDYYQNLYKSQFDQDDSKINRFLSKITLPKMNDLNRDSLDLPFTMREISEAFSSLKSGKSPGDDGFTSEFYKEFKDLLIPPYMEVLDQIKETHLLPKTFLNAIITVIPKKDRDVLKTESYRPISLLNVDYKIMAKMLANRMAKYLPDLIHLDQAGFIKNRYSKDNIARLISLISLYKKKQDLPLVVTLDAEKAFDRLEWNFLFKVLEKFGFGNIFINWIKTIYNEPSAKVVTNGQISPKFSLTRSTRQGCPLSPALFVLAIEPLAELIRKDPKIVGIKVGMEEHKISLFADDVLIYMTKSITSLQQLSIVLREYGEVSGYKINSDKSEVMALSQGDYTRCKEITQFRWAKEGIKYLGVKVDTKLENLYKLNYLSLFVKIKKDLENWKDLPITLMGRVNCIKMNIFPRIQYLFQSIPFGIPQKFFKDLNFIIRKFLWKGKLARVSMEKLTWNYELGGMQLPNFQNYYNAAQLKFINEFFDTNKTSAWIKIELNNMGENFKEEIIYKWDSKLISVKKKNSPIMKHLLEVWNKVDKEIGRRGLISLKTPIYQNGLMPFTENNQLFKIWFQKGIKKINECFEAGRFITFSRMKDKFNLMDNSLFAYYQLKTFLIEKLGHDLNAPRQNELELLITNGEVNGFISQMYKLFQKKMPKIGVHKSRLKWETDLNVNIDENHWKELCKLSMTKIINVRYRLVQYNFFHQLYLTPRKLKKFNPTLSGLCFRCNNEEGSFVHSVWTCPKIQEFWLKVKNFLDKVFNIIFPMDPMIFLFGDIKKFSIKKKLNMFQVEFLRIALAVSKKCIAITWKSDLDLGLERWHAELRSCIPLEKITYNLRNKYHFFLKIWSPYMRVVGLGI